MNLFFYLGRPIMSHEKNERILDKNALVKSFFPDYRTDNGQESESPNTEQIIFGPGKILPYLQTIFFEEHLVEIHIDHTTRIFFASLLDDESTSPTQGNGGDKVLLEEHIEPGAYLKKEESFILTPLTPGIGNAHIRASKQVVLRYYSGTVAIELGCFFQQQDTVQNIPVLRFSYPQIGRVTKTARPYRVKTVSTVEAHAYIHTPDASKQPEVSYNIVDISVMGVAFQSQSGKALYNVDDNITFTIRVKDIRDLTINGIVRRVINLRNQFGYTIIYGVQFDLESRALAAEIEQTVAAIQRLHLRELANRMSSLRGVRIMRG